MNRPLGETGQGLSAGGGRADGVGGTQGARQGLAHPWVVVHDEDVRASRCCHGAGSLPARALGLFLPDRGLRVKPVMRELTGQGPYVTFRVTVLWIVSWRCWKTVEGGQI